MFEARLIQGNLLKKLVEALKELVAEVNFDVNSGGISLQAMDSSHVCLVSFVLHSDGFDHFRCDRPLNMGIHIGNLSKVLKCAGVWRAVGIAAGGKCAAVLESCRYIYPPLPNACAPQLLSAALSPDATAACAVCEHSSLRKTASCRCDSSASELPMPAPPTCCASAPNPCLSVYLFCLHAGVPDCPNETVKRCAHLIRESKHALCLENVPAWPTPVREHSPCTAYP